MGSSKALATDTHSQRYGASVPLLDYVLREQVARARPRTVVDFGAGGGKNGRLLREILGESVRLIAIEGCAATAQMLQGAKLYDEVHCRLLQDWLREATEQFDLATFGDVLEHLTPREIHRVVRRSQTCFREIIVVVPLGDIIQGAEYGNPLEVHRTYITSGYFDRYKPVEKHIAVGGSWTIMNVRISGRPKVFSLRHRIVRTLFHSLMLVLQPIGLGGALACILRKYFTRYHWILRNIYSE
jgi:hypothetical protein